MPETISNHYDQQLQADRLINKIRQLYPDGPTPYQLAPIDQLHIGGIKASMKLLERLSSLKPERVLEIGSGLGGLMRLAEKQFNFELVGLDITHELNKINQSLSFLSHAKQSPQLLTADAQNLPLADSSFDLLIFQHSLLNMPDAMAVLREGKRVLKPQGMLLMHEVILGYEQARLVYPVPWARNENLSHLKTELSLTQLLTRAGFSNIQVSNWSNEALLWRQRQQEKEDQQRDDPTDKISPTLILGEEFLTMGANVIKNLKSGSVQVIELSAQLN